MKSTLPTYHGKVTTLLWSAFYLFTGAIIFAACHSDRQQKSVVFEQQEDHYTAQAIDYELALSNNKVEVFTNEENFGNAMTIAGDHLVAPQQSKNGIIQYKDAFDQTDLIFYDKGNGHAAYDLILEAGADPTDIKMQVESNAYLTDEGELAIPVEGGTIKHSKPYAYQEIDGEKIEVDSRFALAEGILSFELGEYNPDYELVIDPEIRFEASSIISATAEEGEFSFLSPNSYAITASRTITNRGNNTSGPVTTAEGAPDGNSTEIGVGNNYIVLTLADELPIGTKANVSLGATYTGVGYGDASNVNAPCELGLSYVQNSCVDNTDGTFTATYDLVLNWETPPTTGDITLTLTGDGTLNTSTVSAATIAGGNSTTLSGALTVPADGNGTTMISASFDDETTCNAEFSFKAPVPCSNDVATCASTSGCIGGNVFEDFNCNGTDDVNESGVQGIEIQIYDCTNSHIGTGYSDAEGDWQVCGLTDGTAYRVEFVLPEAVSCWATPTHVAGGSNQSDVQFLTAPACTQFSVSNPDDYCLNTDAKAVTSCFAPGDPSNGIVTNLPAIVSVNYDDINTVNSRLSVLSPAISPNEFIFMNSANGSAIFDLTGTMVLADDGSADGDHGCNALINASAISGNIAVMVASTPFSCGSSTMATNAINAGATALIIITNDPARPDLITVVGGAAGIPVVAVSYNTGQAILPLIGSPNQIRLQRNDLADFSNVLATIGEVGATWGLSFNESKKEIYLASVLKRHTGFGPDGIGAIYRENLNTGVLDLFYDLGTLAGSGGYSSNAARLLVGEGPTDATYDTDAFGFAGKAGLGDLDISEDDQTLWVVNLFDQKIYQISTDNPSPGSAVAIPDIPDVGCSDGIMRPFALKVHDAGNGERVYVGLVCDGQLSGDISDVNAYVLAYNPVTMTWSSPLLTIPMDYSRQAAGSNTFHADSDWRAWTDSYITMTSNGFFANNCAIGGDTYPQPLLSDIEFDDNGDMILGFIDRSGLQFGFNQYQPGSPYGPGGTQLICYLAAGDVLRAGIQSTTSWTVEDDGQTTGIGGTRTHNASNAILGITVPQPSGLSGADGREFYWGEHYIDSGVQHWETSLGGLAVLPNTDELVLSAYDPSGSSRNAGGFSLLSNLNGSRLGGIDIYDQNSDYTFRKGVGLGDVELFCNATAPLEIGNYVWCDSLNNGIQDACERGISDIIVQLYDRNGALVGQDTTVNGQYYFNENNVDTTGITVDGSGMASPVTTWSGMSYSTQYFIVFGDGQFATDKFTVGSDTYGITAMANAGSNDNIDSDVDGGNLTTGSLGARPNGLPFIDMTTSAAGCGDHKYDLGVTCNVVCKLDLSYNQTSCTDNVDGTFTATYDITLTWTGAPSTGDLTLNLFGNGTLNTTTVSAATIAGGTTTTLTSAFTVPADGNGNTGILAVFDDELTCKDSIGFKAPVPCPNDVATCAGGGSNIGGSVFEDFNYDGTDAGTNEPGLQGIKVYLYDCDGSRIDSTFTDADGDYIFEDTGNGGVVNSGESYRVEFELPESVSCWAEPTQAGTNNGTTIQFASAGDCASLGIASPSDYCEINPSIMIPCYENGLRTGNTNTGLIEFKYDDSQTTGTQNKIADIEEIGSVWGTTYQAKQERIFTTALLKRHVDLGSQGTGGIYVIDYGNPAYPITNFNLQGSVPAVGPALDFGTINRNSAAFGLAASNFELSASSTTSNIDLDAYTKIGTVGYGDVDLDESQNTLWTVNVNQRSLINMDISGSTLPGTLEHYLLDNLSGFPTCPIYTNTANTTLRINVGGNGFIDNNGNTWQTDQFGSGGSTAGSTGVLVNLDNPYENTLASQTFYRNLRAGGSFNYNVPVSNGRYQIILHHKSGGETTTGSRVFDISAEGDLAVDNFDIAGIRAGVAHRATTVQFVVDVTDGNLDLDFAASSGSATLSGIEVLPIASGTSGVVRPWGLAFHKGRGYLGVVCDASNSLRREDLIAQVLSFDPDNMATGFTTEASFSLDYNREIATTQGGLLSHWTAWRSEITMLGDINDPSYRRNASQPILSDIEFTENGSMVLGFMDRTGNQEGFFNSLPYANTNRNNGNGHRNAGDIIHLCNINGSFLLEQGNGGGTCGGNDDGAGIGIITDGPSNMGEFYYEDNFNNPGFGQHFEIATGGLLQLKGTGEILSSVYDPTTQAANNGLFSQGIHWYNNTTGAKTDEYVLIESTGFVDPTTFGKANGLGDPNLLCDPAPIEIGNYVWEDTDKDGIQDGCEPGVEGVIVQLYDRNGNLVGQDTTDANGQYYFNASNVDTTGITVDGMGNATPDNGTFTGLSPETEYFVVFGDGQTMDGQPTVDGQLYDFTQTDANDPNSELDDEIDSDVNGMNLTNDTDEPAGIPDGLGFISVTTPTAGTVDHSLDVGLTPVELGAIGNYVWVDEDSDGLQDEGERGIPNVRIILKDGMGNPLDTTYTDSDGKYLFPDLPAADYFVDVDETSLPTGLSQTTIFTNNVDGDDADTVTDDGDLGNKDHSGNGYAITLDSGEENLTADFGYNFNPTDDVNNPMGSPTAALGDRIWIDSNGDGVQDANEVGVSGAEVTLTGPGPDGILGSADDVTQTTTTDENGYYIFTGLTPGAYVTEVTDDTNASHPILGNDFTQTGDPDDFGTIAAMPDNRQTDPIVLGPGDVFLNSDYGYQPGAGAAVGSIGNTIWLDADADGNGPADSDPLGDGDNGTGAQDDNNEEPITGVSVILIADTNGNGIWDDGEAIIASDVTDENGNYLFEGLPLDDGDGDADYIVWVNDTDNVLSGLKNTFDEDGGVGNDATGLGDDADMVGGMSAVALDAGTPDDRNQDFGYTPQGNDAGEGYIGNYVWFDTDGNDAGGQADAETDGDSGIEGVVMELLDENGTVIATTKTNENGFYLFGGLTVDVDGEMYQVRVAASNFAMGGVLEGLESTFEPDGDNDDEGDLVTLTTASPGNLDQDFGYTGDDANTLGSIGSTIWEDSDADGVYEPDGQDGTASTADDETPLAGVTVDLYRDLNGDGIINPGEPKYGTMTTDAMGMYLFDNLPLGDYIVDVTDEAGVLNGYWHSLGSQDAGSGVMGNTADDASGGNGGDNSKEDAFAVTIDETIPNNLNVDFGYYKEAAAVGNYVWLDVDRDGLQDDGETGINGILVTMNITYPDGTMVTLTTMTMNDASGNPGFYEFPNLLLDEDYNKGAGVQGGDPNTTDPNAAGLPRFVISVDTNQDLISGNNGMPTTADVNSNGNDLEDSDNFGGVLAIPTQGSEDTSAKDPETTETNPIASYDFGIVEIKLGAIGNYIWVDEDSDGLQDEGERGIANVRVILKDGMGNPLDTTYTDSDGKYLFPDLVAGDYNIDVDETSLPTGLSQTTIFTNNVDGADTDSVTDDGDLGNKDHSGNGYSITLDEGEENLTADFGYNFNPTDDVNNPTGSPTAALGDRIWIDSNGDGVQDANEVGVSGVEVTLTGPGPDGILGSADDVMQTTTTDANGYYIFTGLTPGAYVTEVTDDTNASHEILGADYTQTGDPDDFGAMATMPDNKQTNPIVLGPGDVYLNSDYGYQPQASAPVGSIGNTIWFDADADGNGPADSDVLSDGDNGIGAQDDNNEEPIAGVSVSLIADTNGNGIWDDGEQIIASDVTDSGGNYLFEGLPLDDGDGDADYIVWVNDSDNVLNGLESTFDEDNQAADVPDATGLGDNAANVGGMSAVALDAGTPDDRDQDFGYAPAGHDPDEGFIGNYVWFDTDGNDVGGQADAESDGDSGIEGVVMELIYARTGEVVSITETDENGFYFFGNLVVDLDGEEYQVRVAANNFDPGGVLEGLESTFEPDGDNDNAGDPILLTTANPGNLDQDFGYTADDTNTVGSIGSTIWEDTDADGVYEPDGVDATASTGDDETPLAGVTVDLYRDLNGDGIINSGEPKYGTMTTDAMGMYLFDNLPLGDYIVDVTDEAGILNGYNHSLGSQNAASGVTGDTADDASGGNGGDNSKEDAFAVTITNAVPNNLNVDFGYYKEPAAVGNYVFADNNANGLQDAGDTPIAGVVVKMDITYPDGTMVTLTDTTDASGFYEFPNLLLDEDYRTGAGTGADGEDPTGVSSTGTQTPKYVISVDPNQTPFTTNNLSPTMADVTSNTNDPLNDSEDFDGVVAIPVQGSENTAASTNTTDASGSANEAMEAKYDFGVAPVLDLATNIMIMSMTPAQGYYDEDDEITFAVNVFNQGKVPVSDVTITNYLPTELENAALTANSLLINGMAAPAGVTIMKVGNDYVIDFGTDSNNWFGPDDELTFKYTADITNGTTPNTEITNTVEISAYDTDNNTGTTPPNDVDSMADNMNGGDGETPGSGLEDDATDQDALNNTGEDSDDHDIVIIPTSQVLPVELLDFEAKADKDHIDLIWSTASELNNSHFELERSEDGKIFKQIGRVEGQGTTLEATDYAYEDNNAIGGILYYYRLKQMDIDRQFEYSEVRTAQLEVEIGELELYPNPIGDDQELQVRFYTTELTKEFVIMDIHNRSILQVKQDLRTTGWNTVSIDISALPAGTYILLDNQGNSKRFVKARE